MGYSLIEPKLETLGLFWILVDIKQGQSFVACKLWGGGKSCGFLKRSLLVVKSCNSILKAGERNFFLAQLMPNLV